MGNTRKLRKNLTVTPRNEDGVATGASVMYGPDYPGEGEVPEWVAKKYAKLDVWDSPEASAADESETDDPGADDGLEKLKNAELEAILKDELKIDNTEGNKAQLVARIRDARRALAASAGGPAT